MSYRTDVARVVTGLAEYYNKTLTETQLSMYVEDLMDLSPEDLVRACRMYRQDPKHEWFPLPNKIKAMLYLPDDQRARESVARILTAVSRIGPYNSRQAREMIGELGWEVVKLQGGWEEICQTLSDENKGILQAQWRDLAISLVNRNRIRVSEETAALEFKFKPSGRLDKFEVQIQKKEASA